MNLAKLSLSLSTPRGGSAAASIGATATVFPTTPDVHYHPNSQTATLNGSNKVTACPDLRGLATLSGINASAAEIGPVEMTDALGRKFWRFGGTAAAIIANTLTALDSLGMTTFMVVRVPQGANAHNFFSPRYSAYTDDVTNTTYSGGSSLRTANPVTSSALFLYGAGVGTHTDTTNSYKMIPGAQMQVIGINSRTTGNGAQRVYINNDTASIAARGGTATACVGGVIGAIPAASNVVTPSGAFDLYEFALWKGTLTNAQSDAIAAAMVANYGISQLDSQILIDGDSINAGVASAGPTIFDGLGAILTDPGAGYVGANVRVISRAASGSQTSTLTSNRDAATGGINYGNAAMIYPGGASKNRFVYQIGSNDWSESGGQKNSADWYALQVALLNTAVSGTTAGYLQRGWMVHLMVNIAGPTTATTTNNLPSETTIQQRLEASRALVCDLSGHVPQSAFLTDCLANTGQTYEGLLTTLETCNITVSSDTKFLTSTDALDTGSGYYHTDARHLKIAGMQLMVSGGDTPQYGIASVL